MNSIELKRAKKLLNITYLAILTLLMVQEGQAALLNGSFETGVAYPGGLNIFSPGTPVPWTATSFTPDCYDNSAVDGWPLTGIPAYGGMFQGMLAQHGKRFLGFAAGSTFNEAFSQTTAPLTGGQTYTISASLAAEDSGKAANFGGPYTGRGKVDVYLNSNLIGTLAPNTTSLTWEQRSFSFVAPFAATAVFEFVAAMPIPGLLDPSYIGIDSISLVPEPGSIVLVGLGLLVLSGRSGRRRSI